MNIGRFKLTSTNTILNPNTKMCTMIWAPSGTGKTALAGTLNDMTLKFFGKPTIYIATEVGEGGGAVTNANWDRNIPLFVPQNHAELEEFLVSLRTDRQFGGVVLDNATEAAKRYAQPYALNFPSREKKPTRSVGVPERSDYQTMGEIVRQYFQKLINLTTDPNPDLRKHVVIVAADKIREDQDTHSTTFWGPDLPGAMAQSAAQMMQTVGSISIKAETTPDPADPKRTIRVMRRYFNTGIDGIRTQKDRFKLLPPSIKIRDFDNPNSDGEDFLSIWEKFWLPAMAATEASQA